MSINGRRRAPLSTIGAGQPLSAQVAGARVTVYGSEARGLGVVTAPVALLVMNEGDDPRIVLRDPTGVADQIVEHLDQPGQYVDERGNWEQTDRSTNWRQVGNAHLRVYDLIEPTTG